MADDVLAKIQQKREERPVDPEEFATIIPFPVRSKPARKPVEPACTPVVSPKIVRLMRAPRRRGLERSGSGVMGRVGGEARGEE
jgi:hypothetical protein